jgi:hypothetical protein
MGHGLYQALIERAQFGKWGVVEAAGDLSCMKLQSPSLMGSIIVRFT